MQLRIRIAGYPDLEVEADPSATVMDAKVAATAGCDIDPEIMKIVVCGRVLNDSDELAKHCVDGQVTLHIARGAVTHSAPAASKPPTATETSMSSSHKLEGNTMPGSDGMKLTRPLQLTLRLILPGGVEDSLDNLCHDEPVVTIRQAVASRCDLAAEQVHLLHKAKVLRDGATLRQYGINDGDVLRIARRGAQHPANSVGQKESEETSKQMSGTCERTDAPIPMAWADHPIERPLSTDVLGMTEEQLQQLMQGIAGRRMPPMESQGEWQQRLAREAANMAGQVQAYLSQAEQASGELRAGGPDDNESLVAHIAGVLAEAHARGAPVPRARFFVDRELTRRREARALQARLDREAVGLDPDLEDAFVAAQRSAAAAETAPRRLGGQHPRPR